MARIIILGTGHAVPDLEHENAHLMILQGEHGVLVDCASNPVTQLKKAGVDLELITDLILTHFHPDHVSGAPLLLMSMWLLGRKKPLRLYGLQTTMQRLRTMMDLYEWKNWPDFFPVEFVDLPDQELSPVIDAADLKIYSSPVQHLLPTIGLRIEFYPEGKTLAYSCDTEPCPQVVRLAKGADILLHESTGASRGHSSALQAVAIFQEADAKELYLIHYSARGAQLEQMLKAAREKSARPVRLTHDLMAIDF
jgi:ribonuclease Z